MKKSTKKAVVSFWGKVFFPEVFEAAEAAERKYKSYVYINKKIIFDITNNYYKKTIRFSVHFPSEDVIEVYELFLDNNKRSYRLVQKSEISNSSHVLINILKPKHRFGPQYLNIYCGKRTN